MNKLNVFFVFGLLVYGALGQQNKSVLTPEPKLYPGLSLVLRPGSTTTTAAITADPDDPTTLAPEVQQCIRDCPVTSEYDPVCGTNNETYDNVGRLMCAQACGVNVQVQHTGRCPTPPSAV